MELVDSTLLFLDVFFCKMNDSSITRTIHCKLIANFSTVSYSALVPIDYKLSNFRHLINRACIVCYSTDKLNAELKFIKDFAFKDGFPLKMIIKLITSKLNPVCILNNQSQHMLKNIFMLCIFCLFESLKPKLKKLNFKLTAKSPPLIQNQIHFLYSRVYEIPFIYRNFLKRSKYIGETVRSLEIKVKE